MTWDFHLVYLISHLAKHFTSGGVGIRQFLDIAHIINKCSINWGWVEASLREVNLYAFAIKVFQFCKEWFDVDVPIELQPVDEELFVTSTAYIMNNGVFGFYNPSNEANQATNIYRKRGFLGLIMEAVERIFPKYSVLSNTNKYSFLKKHSWLLPVAWILRLFSGMHHLRRGKDYIIKPFVSNDVLKEKDQFFLQWGL